MVERLDKLNGISVIMPTIREKGVVIDSIKSVILSLQKLKTDRKELLLSVNRTFTKNDILSPLLRKYPFVKTIIKKHNKGSAYARYLGIQKAKYNIILFTDDDCIVGTNWASEFYKNVIKYGICTGMLKAGNPNKTIAKLEEIIDYYRITAKDKCGKIKWLSFPNFGIKKELLPKVPFNLHILDTVEDMSLACRLRLKNKEITLIKNLIVKVDYPKNFLSAAQRKIKHAKGLTFLKKSLNENMKEKIDIESTLGSLKRWLKISFKVKLSFGEKITFLLLNMIYVLGLFCFESSIKNVRQIHDDEL